MKHTPVALLASLALAACVSAPPDARLEAPAPAFDAVRFFDGRTRGEGELKTALSRARAVHVAGSGHVEADGTLVLDQSVAREGAKPERREWRIRPDGHGRYTGTLSDAAGTVTGETVGNRLHLAFPMKGGLRAEQWLYLQPDGQTAINRMTIRKFGVPVAALRETIRRVP